MPSEASKRMAREWVDAWIEGVDFPEQQFQSLAALLDQRAEAAEAEVKALVGALERISKMPCIHELLGEPTDDCACASCNAKATLARARAEAGGGERHE